MTTSVLWERFRRLAEFERTLPDGRIEGTSIEDWQAVLDLVRDERWRARLLRGDERSTGVIPHDAAELFPEEEVVTLSVWPDPRIQLNLFPMETSSIDFDFDTAEIVGVQEFEILLDAVARLAQAACGDVRLSHEGVGEAVIMTVSADGKAQWSDTD